MKYVVLLTVLLAITLFAQPTYHTIYDIQKTADGLEGDSPFVGDSVITSGIVTSVAAYGFSIQDSAGAWNGIWVYTSDSAAVTLGDSVEVTGVVAEYYNFTEIDADTGSVVVLASGKALPGPVLVPTGDFPAEAYEGVFVRFENAVCVSPDLGYGEWEVDDGSGAARVDDKFYKFTPDSGETYNLVGIGWYSYGNFKLEPRFAEDIQVAAPPTVIEYRTIYEIQKTPDGGEGDSPFVGDSVKTSGIVTFVTSYGFSIQDSAGAWNGLWVYTGDSAAVTLGDSVEVTGEVAEYYNYTELSANSADVVVLASGKPLPGPVVLPTGDFPVEAYEGVFVQFENATCVNPDLGYGEWEVDDGSGAARVDDKFVKFTPDSGQVYNLVGIGWYSYGNFKLEPRYEEDIQVATGLNDTRQQVTLAKEFRLLPAYPNPFNPSTTIRFEVPANIARESKVELTIYNIAGQKVATLLNGKVSAGFHEITWNVEPTIASGTYFAVLKAGKQMQVRKLLYVR